MNKEEMHDRITDLMKDPMRQMVAHALIELGRPLECQMPLCIRPKERDHFEKTGPLRISLDHIIERSLGGGERPENIRFAHLACNTASGVASRYSKKQEEPPAIPLDAFSELATIQQQLVVASLGFEPALESRWRFDNGEVFAVDSQS